MGKPWTRWNMQAKGIDWKTSRRGVGVERLSGLENVVRRPAKAETSKDDIMKSYLFEITLHKTYGTNFGLYSSSFNLSCL